MLFDETYNTITTASEGIFKDRGSKFVGLLFPIQNDLEFKNHYKELKSIHSKANHHCFAWRLSPARNIFKVNDDGEPSGTAGRPILNQLLSNELTDCAIVVVRYFGGTLLGVPGLINAYKEAAAAAIANNQIITREIVSHYAITFPYELMNEVMKKIKHYNANITNQEQEELCTIYFTVAKKHEILLIDDIQNNYNFVDKVELKNINLL
nr:YigZ family protein [Bacteroidota bacterium]